MKALVSNKKPGIQEWCFGGKKKQDDYTLENILDEVFVRRFLMEVNDS